MMKAVIRELAQARRHYATLPLFEFLRSDAIAPRDRLAFFPAMAPFVLAFPDLNRFVLRDEASGDPYQLLVNEFTYQNDQHWTLYLEDIAKLGFDRSTSLTQLLRAGLKDNSTESRLLVPRLAQILYRASPLEKFVIVESIAGTSDVLIGVTHSIATRVYADGGPELRYLRHAQHRYDLRVLEGTPLNATQRVRCLDLCFRVFDVFADWTNELLAHARASLARQAVPNVA
jgi:hypothetical protein